MPRGFVSFQSPTGASDAPQMKPRNLGAPSIAFFAMGGIAHTFLAFYVLLKLQFYFSEFFIPSA